MRFDAPVWVGWFRLSFCVADSDDKDIDIDIDDERFSLFCLEKFYKKTFGAQTTLSALSSSP